MEKEVTHVIAKVGDQLKSYETGKIYEVKITTDQWVVVQAVDGLSQVMTSWENLKLLYNIPIPKAEG